MIETVMKLAENKVDNYNVGRGLVALGVGISMIGCLGVGLGQGITAGKAVEAVGRNPEAMSKIRTLLLLGCDISESSALYSLVLGILLLFVYK